MILDIVVALAIFFWVLPFLWKLAVAARHQLIFVLAYLLAGILIATIVWHLPKPF